MSSLLKFVVGIVVFLISMFVGAKGALYFFKDNPMVICYTSGYSQDEPEELEECVIRVEKGYPAKGETLRGGF